MERKKFLEKYGNVMVKFDEYYKYVFTFSAEIEEGIISVSVGGNSEEIYRFSVSANEECSISSLGPFEGSIYKDGQEVTGFYDY